MYIALASVHALVLCGLQFVACVRGQWTGKCRRRPRCTCTLWGERGGRGRRDPPVSKEIVLVILGVK